MIEKFLKVVTITGADDHVNQRDLFDLSSEFPFVEWGILFNGKGDTPRFPSSEWISELESLWTDALTGSNTLPRFACHVSGQLMRDIASGAPFAPEIDVFDRVQFNLKSCSILNESFLSQLIDEEWTQYIFQVSEFCDDFYRIAKNIIPSCCPLFDQSAGTGLLPTGWEIAQEFSGFAGGLSPENLSDQIELIAKAAGDFPAWIDVESGVRTENQFDLNKVRQFLEIAEPYVL